MHGLVDLDRATQAFSDGFAEFKRVTAGYFEISRRSDYRGGIISRSLFIPPKFLVGHTGRQADMLELWIECCSEAWFSLEVQTLLGRQTPLLYAAERLSSGSPLQVQLLVAYGANVHAVDSTGRGALSTVLSMPDRSWSEHAQEAEAKLAILLEAGCDPNHVDNAGISPARHASVSRVAWAVWMSALTKTEGRRTLLKDEEELGIEGALRQQNHGLVLPSVGVDMMF